MELYLDPIIKPKAFRNRSRYTEEEISIIKELYPYTPNIEIAKLLGRKARTIGQVARRIGLRKSEQYMNKMPGCFKKGMKAWNKGIKGYMKANKTSFRKGNIPPNRVPIGTISKRWHKKDKKYYLYIKTGQDNWELLHRYVWRKHKGDITEGHVITFRDLNSENCQVNNLMLLSRSENMERNRNRGKAKESMRQLWKREKMRAHYGLRPVSGIGKRL